MMERTLPAAFVELQKTHLIDPEEEAELLRYIDEFEQLREEHVQTQGYGWTRKSEETLWQRLNTAMLKATYIPKDTQELLDLPSQLRTSFGLMGVYDPVDQVCWCIKYQYKRYFPQALCHKTATSNSAWMLANIAELLYLQRRSHLSIDEMNESHVGRLWTTSKRTLSIRIASTIELGFLQGTPLQETASRGKLSRQVNYEFAPLFAALRTIQRHMREEKASVL